MNDVNSAFPGGFRDNLNNLPDRSDLNSFGDRFGDRNPPSILDENFSERYDKYKVPDPFVEEKTPEGGTVDEGNSPEDAKPGDVKPDDATPDAATPDEKSPTEPSPE
jgi:hypothetical protein